MEKRQELTKEQIDRKIRNYGIGYRSSVYSMIGSAIMTLFMVSLDVPPNEYNRWEKIKNIKRVSEHRKESLGSDLERLSFNSQSEKVINNLKELTSKARESYSELHGMAEEESERFYNKNKKIISGYESSKDRMGFGLSSFLLSMFSGLYCFSKREGYKRNN